jgi:hypothetical protein
LFFRKVQNSSIKVEERILIDIAIVIVSGDLEPFIADRDKRSAGLSVLEVERN